MRMEVTDFMAVIFNPVAQAKFVHTVSAGYVCAATFVLGVSAWYLLRGRYVQLAKRSFVIASAFGDMGFEVVSGPLFQTPDETVVLALQNDVDVVGASSLAAGHKTLIPELIQRLREAGRNDIKVIAGGVIPPQDYDYLRNAGVQGIYGPGSNVVECAADVLRLLGHNMPPPGSDIDSSALEAAE